MITKIETLKHNIWTNDNTRYLYEGKYSPILDKYIEEFIPSTLFDEVNFRKLPHFKVRLKSMKFVGYDPKKTYLSLDGFSALVVSLMRAWKITKIEKNIKIAREIEKILIPIARKEFLAKIAITRDQAKTLMTIQYKDLSKKELVEKHKTLGFHKRK